MHLLGGQKGEPVFQIEAHLIAEHALGADARTVALVNAVFTDVAQQIKVLFHICSVVATNIVIYRFVRSVSLTCWVFLLTEERNLPKLYLK